MRAYEMAERGVESVGGMREQPHFTDTGAHQGHADEANANYQDGRERGGGS
jgi:hypothetical protein